MRVLSKWLSIRRNCFIVNNIDMASKNRQITLRYTPEQMQVLVERAMQSGFSKIAPYIHRISLGEPVNVYLRNGSFDDFVGEAVRLRKALHQIKDEWERAGHPPGPVLDCLNQIDQNTSKIYELCMSRYTTPPASNA